MTYLYHYTSYEAFYNILRSGVMWATHFKSVNDTTELTAAYHALRTALEASATAFAADDHDVNEKLATLDLMMAQLRERFVGLLCFTSESDNLNQWRAYCPHGGLAIRFNAQSLERRARALGYDFVRCQYSEVGIHTSIEALRAAVQVQETDFGDANTYALNQFVLAAAKYKNHHFESEREVRIVSRVGWLHNERPPFETIHERKSGPYIHFPIGPYHGYVPFREETIESADNSWVIDGAVVGPSSNQAEHKRVIEAQAREHGVHPFDVDLSKVPLRVAP